MEHNPASQQSPDIPNNSHAPEVDLTPEMARAQLNQLKAEADMLQTQIDESERALNALTWKDFPALKKALKGLTLKAKDKRIDVFFRTRIVSMVATINLYLDESGRGTNHARNLRSRIHRFLSCGELPMHHYGEFHSSLLEDEDFSADLQTYLLEVSSKGYVGAQNVVDFVQTEEVQKRFEGKTGYGGGKVAISTRTGQRWLKKLDWRYGKKKHGMYMDGHEREDVVAYRKAFCARWKEYEKRMVLYDKFGNIISTPNGFAVDQGIRFRLVPVTHDESTFFARDRRKMFYQHSSVGPTPERKGEGESLMISDFLTLEWGRLIDPVDNEEARLAFEAGKNREGWFANEHLLKQTDRAIDIFESRSNGTMTGLFLYDNAPGHLKRAADALSARTMVKNPHPTWTLKPDGPRMRNGRFADGREQSFYFPDNHPTMPGWFKGSEIILRERGLFKDGLNGACAKACFDSPNTSCCCRKILFCQPDFVQQKSALEELIISRGHLCDFYPKYHCELNFIEQYWGAAKYRYRNTPTTSNFNEMRANVFKSLDDVPLEQIRRYANRSARFIHAYAEGLSGAQAAWANRRYHGHRTLPPDMLAKARAAL
ncbi:hypothetical protein C8R43DRAFT_1083839 [Mycena crocata]|nr:hypothetical protein C8R43DRAFT_1083839 [Mycena crocata]